MALGDSYLQMTPWESGLVMLTWCPLTRIMRLIGWHDKHENGPNKTIPEFELRKNKNTGVKEIY